MRRNEAVAQRYAKALFQLSSQHPEADDIGKPGDILAELEVFQSVLKSQPELRKFFLNPVISKADKKALVADLEQFAPSVIKFIQLLVEADRIEFFDSIVSSFQRFFEESSGELSVELRTAHSLSKTAVEEIKNLLEAEWGRKLKVNVSKDSSLLGGFQARSRSKTFDASVLFQFENLKKQIEAR